MRIIILGAGSIVPTPRRFSSGILLETSNAKILMDAGPGVVEKLRRIGGDPNLIDMLLITHYHIDHVSDLPVLVKLRPFNSWGGKAENPRKLRIYGPRGLREFMEENLFENKFFGYLKTLGCHDLVELEEMWEGESRPYPGLTVKSVPVEHYGGIAYRVEADGRSIVYSGDTVPDRRLISLAKGCDVLIHECSFPRSHMLGKHTSMEDLAEIVGEVKPRLLIPIHLYPIMDEHAEDLERLVREKGVDVFVPDDMDIVEV